MVNYKEFENWFNEIESFGLRSERFFAGLEMYEGTTERNAFIRTWLRAAFESARKEQNETN